jgi:hypothetical protein
MVMGEPEPAEERRRRIDTTRKSKKRLATWTVAQTLLTAFTRLSWFSRDR